MRRRPPRTRPWCRRRRAAREVVAAAHNQQRFLANAAHQLRQARCGAAGPYRACASAADADSCRTLSTGPNRRFHRAACKPLRRWRAPIRAAAAVPSASTSSVWKALRWVGESALARCRPCFEPSARLLRGWLLLREPSLTWCTRHRVPARRQRDRGTVSAREIVPPRWRTGPSSPPERERVSSASTVCRTRHPSAWAWQSCGRSRPDRRPDRAGMRRKLRDAELRNIPLDSGDIEVLRTARLGARAARACLAPSRTWARRAPHRSDGRSRRCQIVVSVSGGCVETIWSTRSGDPRRGAKAELITYGITNAERRLGPACGGTLELAWTAHKSGVAESSSASRRSS